MAQQLPLFEPPLDPGLLINATAAGVDLGSILSDVNGPLPYYRFAYMLQKALEVCAECRSFGAMMLSILERSDAEALAMLRATQETNIQSLLKSMKTSLLTEAQNQLAGLTAGRSIAFQRYAYYQLLLTGSAPAVPAANSTIAQPPIPAQQTVSVDNSGTRLLQQEQSELDSSHSARDWQVLSASTEVLGSALHYIPNFGLDVHPFGAGAHVVFGGAFIGPATNAIARYQKNLSDQDSFDASHAGKMSIYFRRQQEWQEQSNVAAGEMMQIDQQIAAAQARVDLATYDLNTLYPAQLQNAQDIQSFLATKYTNADLYAWNISTLSTTFFGCYQLAYDLAKKAERAFRFERGSVDSNFIQFGYWDSLRKGLQSGERLYLALKQMDRAYDEQNKRDFEITKRISLVLLDPLAVVALKETGQCTIDLPESLFDADFNHHYLRRIKYVSLTIPCVAGPYTSVNCTLTLLKSRIRFDSNPQPQYVEGDNDPRFIYNFASTQSISTSTAQNDGGIFEVNFRDERYLPFEYAGAISQWQLAMPKASNAFDYETISDVILNISYTAREGGQPLGQAAAKALAAQLPQEATRLVSLRHEFPTQWYLFGQPTPATAGQLLTVDIEMERFSYLLHGRTLSFGAVESFVVFRDVYDATAFKLDHAAPTPLGDYAKATALPLYLTPPGGTAVKAALPCDSTYNGIPHGTFDLSSSPGTVGIWQLNAEDADLLKLPASLTTSVVSGGATHYRLRADLIVDIMLVFHFTVM